jgi:hypothetical protein
MKTKNTDCITATPSGNLAKLIASLGGITRSCNDVRHCSRCKLPPKKDTHLFAKTIPANYAMASIHLLNIETSSLPEALRPIWTSLVSITLTKMQSASKGMADNDYFFTGEDCRLVVKVIDFMLSFSIPNAPKCDLIQIVKHLGYVGLAGVLSGESSTGDAELKFENGKLFLKGSSNKAGFHAMRMIPGIVIPRKYGSGAYEAPAIQWKKFIAATMEFWPCFAGKTDEIIEQCEMWIAANSTKPAEQKNMTGKLIANIVNRSRDFTLSFIWDKAITRPLVDEIKSIPCRERSYDPMSKVWTIDKTYKEKIVKLFSEHYDVVEAEGVITPAPVQSPYKPRYGSRGYGAAYYPR